jgi:hypothetical protein
LNYREPSNPEGRPMLSVSTHRASASERENP